MHEFIPVVCDMQNRATCNSGRIQLHQNKTLVTWQQYNLVMTYKCLILQQVTYLKCTLYRHWRVLLIL